MMLPAPLIVVLAEMVCSLTLINGNEPQLNVTVPPPESLAAKAESVQLPGWPPRYPVQSWLWDS